MFREHFALIPARGNSKGIVRKNMSTLNGKPLLFWTIKAAKDSGVFYEIAVSSEDREILEYAESEGATPLLRPEKLSADDTPSEDVLLHALSEFGIKNGYAALLQPTSPLRSGEDITGAFDFIKETGADTLISGCKPEKHPYKNFLVKGDFIVPLSDKYSPNSPRQILPPAFCQNGAIYIVKVEYFSDRKKFFGGRTAGFFMDRKKSVDIDTPYDLKLAEMIMEGEL